MHPFADHLRAAIADARLLRLAESGAPASEADATAIQLELIETFGGPSAWKASPWNGQSSMPAAPIPADWVHANGDDVVVPPASLLEVEFAIVVDATGAYQLALAFEFVGSRLERADAWPPTAKLADLLSTRGLVIGEASPLPAFEEKSIDIRLTTADTDQTNSTTLNVSALVNAADEVKAHATGLGIPFAAGTVLMSGARIGPIPFASGTIRAEAPGIGSVEAKVSGQ